MKDLELIRLVLADHGVNAELIEKVLIAVQTRIELARARGYNEGLAAASGLARGHLSAGVSDGIKQ